MAAPASSLPAAAIDALRRGNAIEAIRILRAAAPLGLKEAKDAIDAYRRSEALASTRSSAADPGPAAAAARHAVEQNAVVDRMRSAAGFGLAQATDANDASRFRDRPHGVGGRSPGEVPRSGLSLRWVAIVALAYALYSFIVRSIHT